jgi:HD-GYP domain-containing protein (c-di-GMP phosphodiesterase class II)
VSPEPRLAEITASLALSAEAAAGVPPETSARAAMVAVVVAEAAGLGAADQAAAYHAALLRYVGCTSFAVEMAWVGDGDDLSLMANLATADAASPASVVRRAGRGRAALARAKTVARLLGDPAGGRKLSEAHCAQAVALASTLELPDGVVPALGDFYERWDGKGPRRIARERIDPVSRALRVAFALVTHASIEGPAAADEVLRVRRGGEFDPRIVDAVRGRFRDVIARATAATAWEEALASEPGAWRTASPRRVRDIAAAFAACADLKSPWLIGHSSRVSELCAAAAPAGDREVLRIAGLLHDLGRTSVPNGIWDKPGALGVLEREHVARHASESERILRRTSLLAPYADIVAGTHERRDGSGYPRRSRGGDRLASILAAADVLAALLDDRPHRPARSLDEASRVLLDEVAQGRLDGDAAQAVLSAAGSPRRRRQAAPDALSEREREVLVWLARGLKDAEIARKLFISTRTVSHHVAHIYDKTGVRTRAAAALHAVRLGLAQPDEE